MEILYILGAEFFWIWFCVFRNFILKFGSVKDTFCTIYIFQKIITNPKSFQNSQILLDFEPENPAFAQSRISFFLLTTPPYQPFKMANSLISPQQTSKSRNYLKCSLWCPHHRPEWLLSNLVNFTCLTSLPCETFVANAISKGRAASVIVAGSRRDCLATVFDWFREFAKKKSQKQEGESSRQHYNDDLMAKGPSFQSLCLEVFKSLFSGIP